MSERVWTESEKTFVRENAGRLKDEELAATLSRLTGRYVSVHAVRHIRAELGIKKRPGRGVCSVRKPPKRNAVTFTIRADR